MNAIPDAAIEAAVRASYRRNDWGDECNRKFIERALEAAAPHISAQALEGAAGDLVLHGNVRDRLHARAAAVRATL